MHKNGAYKHILSLCLGVCCSYSNLSCVLRSGSPPLLASQAPSTPLLVLHRQTSASQSALEPRQQVVQKARSLLQGQPWTAHQVRFERDPVGFVQAAFWQAKV